MYHLEFDQLTHHVESMIFELKIRKEIWYIILVYKNPDVSNNILLSKLIKVYECLISKAKEIILLGDLNINMKVEDNDLKNELCDVYNLTNLIKEPTCYKKPEGTLIDPIIVRHAKRFKNSINIFCDSSDFHHLVGCISKLHLPPRKPFKIAYRTLKNFNENDFKLDVSRIPFHISDIFIDEGDKYWVRNKLFTDVLNDHAPLKERSIKEDHIPYMNSILRKEMYKRSMLKNIHKKNPKNNLKFEQYRIQRNKVTDMRRSAIRNHFLSKCKPGASPKDFYDAIGPFLSKKSKSHTTIMLKEGDRVITDTKDLCTIFANHFSTIANSIGCPDEIDMSEKYFLSSTFEKHCDHKSVKVILKNIKHGKSFNFKEVDSMYVKKLLCNLKVNKSTGYDNVPPKMVKICADELAIPITELLNSAFKNKQFPDDLKRAEISPIFKKDDDMMKEKYRPVSILSVFSKVFETIIANQLMEFFKDIFNDMLCAYRKKYSCEHLLIKLIDSWKFSLDENNFAGTILMDLSKAFDCMPHGLLIAKMKAYGLSDNACEYMSSYLSNRYQRVKISNERSAWMPLLKGIPQGSCLGPFLFNIFMNDLFYFIETCTLMNYADDNTLSKFASTIKSVLDALTQDAKNSIEWFKINFMQANPEKFQFMLLKSLTCKEEIPEFINVDGVQIKAEQSVKLLGILIDDKLKFDKHIDILCKNAARQINILYRFTGIFDFKERELIHNIYVMSNFNYCPIVWHFCGKVNATKMEKIQKRALRFLFNNKVSSNEFLLEKCKSTTLHLKRMKIIALEVFKSLNDLNPKFMNEMFNRKEMPYDLRDPDILVPPKFKKITYGKNTFRYHGAHIWNLLPSVVKSCTTIDNFKLMLKAWDGPKCQCSMCSFT
jgi:hypothetical protein